MRPVVTDRKRAAPKRKMRRAGGRRPAPSGFTDEADRFLLWLTSLGDPDLLKRLRSDA